MTEYSLYLCAYTKVGRYELPAMETELSLAPTNLIPEINAFLRKMSDHVQLIIRTCLPQEPAVPVSVHIEVGQGGELLSYYYGNINATKNLETQLWNMALDIAPELSHSVVCTPEFRRQAETDGAR